MRIKRFDYVVIGAGTAGCAIASRLSEDPSVRVLLLEAGGTGRSPWIQVPAAFSRLFKSRHDWNYATEPQRHAHGRRLYWPRGKVLGGCSALNAMVYVRGDRRDYDGWAALGNAGWSYADVLPYFKRAERNQRGASRYHGAGGPLPVSDQLEPHPWTDAFVHACAELGFRRNPDFNGERQDGVGLYQVTQARGRRSSSATAYLAQVRPNLTVLTGALATKLLLQGDECIGVQYQRRRRAQQVLADGEVILAGGSVNSPQLLLLSGIGPAAQLRALRIPVVHDLVGVGEGLQDHPTIYCVFRAKRPESLLRAQSLRELVRFFALGRGPLTSTLSEAALFARSGKGSLAADLQLNFLPLAVIDHGLPYLALHGCSIGVILNEVRSRGRVRLRSADPRVAPLIDPEYLADPLDLARMLAGVRLARSIAAAGPLAELISNEVLPGPYKRSDEQLSDAIRREVESIYHPVSTCRMGVDERAVVDPQLRVRGLRRLRIADASVMPTHVHGNTNAPTLMIAERAADLIERTRALQSYRDHPGQLTDIDLMHEVEA